MIYDVRFDGTLVALLGADSAESARAAALQLLTIARTGDVATRHDDVVRADVVREEEAAALAELWNSAQCLHTAVTLCSENTIKEAAGRLHTALETTRELVRRLGHDSNPSSTKG